MIRHRKKENDIIYTTDNNYIDNQEREPIITIYNNNLKNVENVENKSEITDYNYIETLVFSSSEMYILSVLGYIDKLLISNKLNLNNIKNYVSSSLGTIVCLYLSFGYKPKEILQIFYNNLTFITDNILNIVDTFGIFEIKHSVNKLLEPLYVKLGFIPTLKDIYNLTNVNCVLIGYNFTKNKTIIYNYKRYPDTKVDEIIQKCCILPFLFKNYSNNNEINLEDLYVDYSLINNEEYEYSIKLFNKSKLLLLKTNVKYEDINEDIDINNINIFEYAKNLFETIQKKEYIDDSYYSNIVNINIKKYNKTLLFDKYVKHKEFIKLYCYWFENSETIRYNHKFHNLNENIVKETCQSDYTGIVISGGGTHVFNLVGGIKYCIDNNIINLNTIDTFIGTSAGSFMCTVLALGFNIEDVIDIYVNEAHKKLNLDIKNICIVERINEKSLYPNKILIEAYEGIFIKHNDGQIPTLLDIKNNYGKNIIFTVFNVTKNKLEYVNYENSPELLVTHACAMSSCIPFIFSPIEYNKCFYIDGGMESNYSIEKTQDYLNKNFIGFGINFLSKYSKINIFQFMYNFIFEKSRKDQINKIKNSKNCDSYCMSVVRDDDKDSLLITKNMIKKYMDSGYIFMNNILKK